MNRRGFRLFLLANFTKLQPEKYDFDLHKEFSRKNGPNSPNLKGKKTQIAIIL
jgi:hypothetical protein